jgi:hypothetical protein
MRSHDLAQPRHIIFVGRGPTPKEIVMHTPTTSSFLRRVLALDAVSCGAMGVGAALLAPTLAGLFNLPADLLRQVGLALLPFAAFVGFLASREMPWRPAVWVVIALNALWIVESVLLLFASGIEPNMLGYAFVIGQAAIVGVITELEYVGLRRAARLATA